MNATVDLVLTKLRLGVPITFVEDERGRACLVSVDGDVVARVSWRQNRYAFEVSDPPVGTIEFSTAFQEELSAPFLRRVQAVCADEGWLGNGGVRESMDRALRELGMDPRRIPVSFAGEAIEDCE